MVKAVDIIPLKKDELTKMGKEEVQKLKTTFDNLKKKSGMKGRRLLTPDEWNIVRQNYDLARDRLTALEKEEIKDDAETGKKHGLLAQKHILKGLGHMKKSTEHHKYIISKVKDAQERSLGNNGTFLNYGTMELSVPLVP